MNVLPERVIKAVKITKEVIAASVTKDTGTYLTVSVWVSEALLVASIIADSQS